MAIVPVAVPIRAPESVASFSIAGVRYNEILKLRVHRAVEELTGEGEVTLSWPRAPEGGKMPMPAWMDGVYGYIHLDGQLAMSFRFDTRTSHGSPTQYELEFHFRGLSSDWIEAVPNHDTGEEINQSVGQIIRRLSEGYTAEFIDQSGESRPLKRFVIAQGETIERAARRAAREFSGNFFENEQGQVVLTKPGDFEGSGGALVLGDRKITHWSVKRDIAPRGGENRVYAQQLPDEDKGIWGAAAQVSAIATTPFGFTKIRAYLADGDHDSKTVEGRAGFEGSRSSSQGLNVTLRVSTWTDVDGALWKLKRQYHVSIPVDGVEETLMLSAVTFFLTPTERYATLVLISRLSHGEPNPVYPSNPTGPNSMTEQFDVRMKDGKVEAQPTKEDEDKPKPDPPPE